MKSEYNQDGRWQPNRIEIESTFAEFIRNYEGGEVISESFPSIPSGTLNADFYIKNSDVIAELKCLEADPHEPNIYSQRLLACYRHFGYDIGSIMKSVYGDEPMPERVRRRMYNMQARSIADAVAKANKQIRSTKIFMERPNAKGLILIANDNNYGFNPIQMMGVLCNAFRQLNDNHTDCIVYFTPNVYHDTGDDVAHSIWSPVYNVGSEDFADFVNPFGASWLDYAETIQGPSVMREAGDDYLEKIALAKPISEFKR